MTFLLREDEDGGALPSAGMKDARLSHLPRPSPTPTLQFADMMLLPITPAARPALGELLAEINRETLRAMRDPHVTPAILPFRNIARLHFARLVILEPPTLQKPWLAFVVDYDGDEGDARCSHERAWDWLMGQLEKLPGLERVLQHCEGYQAGRLRAYLERHRRPSATVYVAAPGRSVAQIRWEAALRHEVERALVGVSGSPAQLRSQVLERLRGVDIPPFPAQPDLTKRIPVELIKRFGLPLSVLAGLSLPLWPLGPVGVGLGAAGLATVGLAAVARFRWLEAHDPQFQPKLNAETHAHMAFAAQDENQFLQNQLSHVVQIKPGPLRALLIRSVFATLQVLAKNQFNQGKLGDIPSIHFARWVLGPDRSVLFFSNFDSSWQSYLGDFIDKASTGLTAVWSNTVRYPRTKWLLRAGSRDAGRFLAWTREHQVPSQVWYSAYPGLSVVNITSNTEIRRGLATPDLVDPVTWLARLRNVDRLATDERFGREQAREPPLKLDDLQGIILKGYGHKNEARYLLLRVQERRPGLVRWLSQLPVTSAVAGARDQDRPDPLLNVAFSYAGMRALGVDQDLCDGFSTAFVQGPTHPDRVRINGDINQDAPEHWSWGGSADSAVHVVLLVFARDTQSVERHTEELLQQAREHGLELVHPPLEASTLPGRKEHFGFRDGIAQPVVRGSGDTGVEQNTIAAGEVFLGHRDGYGNVAVAPASERGFRFGHNGSYMVLRQLEQDVPAFWKSCEEQSKALGLSAQAFASKLVGRWPSGRPLVRYPERDPMPDQDDNDDAFTYFETGVDNDRYGARCPFGAHIRRANPRDWGLGANAEESLRLSNLHRIVRRARPYGPALAPSMKTPELLERALAEAADTTARRGLQFICFNANIERQFEFIQQQWCKNPKFAGQVSDADPILGARCPVQEFGLSDQGMTLQGNLNQGPFQRVNNLNSFVRVRGSAYLFMPSLSALRLLPEVVDAADSPEEAERIEALEQIPDDEQLHIDRLIVNIRKMLKKQYLGKQTLRDAHPKMHGLVRARLEISQDLAPELCTPLFRPGEHYDGWVRLSNQDHVPKPDSEPDTRGLALKLEKVDGVKLLDGEEHDPHHDFIFLSTPRFVTRDVAGFDELINALVNNQPSSWIKSVPALYRHKRSLARHESPLEVTYFSVVPSLVGKLAVKFKLEPVDKTRSPRNKDRDPNYLRTRLEEQLAERDYCFQLSLQRYQDAQSTPVEDPTVVWRTPFEPVAVLRILQQRDFNSDEQRERGENMAFNPFRCLPEHRPLGGINRARRQVYQAISSFRRNRNGVDPNFDGDPKPPIPKRS